MSETGNKITEAGIPAIVIPLLDIIDDMEKALQSSNDTEPPPVHGIHIIYQKLLALLKMHGVASFVSVGMPFDHNLHESVSMAKHKRNEGGIVVNELRRGYLWNNEVLRHAQVQFAG